MHCPGIHDKHHDSLSILSFSFHWVVDIHRIPILIRPWTRRRRKRHLGRITFPQLGLPLFIQNVLQRRVEFLVVRRLLGVLYFGLR